MSSSKAFREVVVTNSGGLNLRGSYSVCKLARQFDCSISLAKATERADATQILQLISLAASPGTHLRLEAEGEEAEAAVLALEKLFAENFGQNDEEDRD
jgi:phosphocarrier protein HPr